MVAPRITVCQLLHSLNVGGAEVLASRIARRLRDAYRFVFVCLDEIGPLGEQLQAEGFPVHVLGRRNGVDWSCPFRLSRLMRSERIDIVHAHQYTPFFYGMTARLRTPGLPIIFTEHGRHQPDYPRRKRMIANRLLLSRRDRIVGVGAAVRDALIVNEGMPANRISVLYNGIDVASYSAAANRTEARTKLGVEQDAFVIIQVARLDYLKDHATALRTMARVLTHQPRARLVLVGDGPERSTIEAMARQLGVAEHLHMLGTRGDIAKLLPGADVFLLTSISEGIPLTVLEAMAAGLPIVSTDVGGLREIVVDGETGWLAPAGDDSTLANYLLRLANHKERRVALGEAGRTRATSLFDEPRMCAEYSQIYEQLAAA